MISNQVIQNSIDELRVITKVDLGIFDTEGMRVASTTDDIDISRNIIENYFDLAEFPITARVDSRTTARPGDSVKFAFDVEKIHVFDKETSQVITN